MYVAWRGRVAGRAMVPQVLASHAGRALPSQRVKWRQPFHVGHGHRGDGVGAHRVGCACPRRWWRYRHPQRRLVRPPGMSASHTPRTRIPAARRMATGTRTNAPAPAAASHCSMLGSRERPGRLTFATLPSQVPRASGSSTSMAARRQSAHTRPPAWRVPARQPSVPARDLAGWCHLLGGSMHGDGRTAGVNQPLVSLDSLAAVHVGSKAGCEVVLYPLSRRSKPNGTPSPQPRRGTRHTHTHIYPRLGVPPRVPGTETLLRASARAAW
jgi:hypothetical protein